MTENGKQQIDGNEEEAASHDDRAQFRIVGQYIKDLSFENPNAPAIFSSLEKQPDLQINVNVNGQKLAEDQYEVAIELKLSAKNQIGVIYALELVYAGVFILKNIPEEALQPVLLVDSPSLLFPFVRHIVVDLTREGGFPPLSLDPINFAALYQNKYQNIEEESSKNIIN